MLLLGRVTYEGFYGAWPCRDGEMADKTKVLGSGQRLYPESPDRLDLTLTESRTTPNGVLLTRYAVG